MSCREGDELRARLLDVDRLLALEELPHPRQIPGGAEILVSPAAGHLLPLVVQHARPAPHVAPAQLDDPRLPVALLPEQLVDLVVEVPDAKLAEAGVLDLGDLLGDLLDDLQPPPLGVLQVVALGRQVGSPLALLVQPLLGQLGLAPPGQRRHGLFRVSSHLLALSPLGFLFSLLSSNSSRLEIVQAPLRNLQQTGVGGEYVVGALVSLEGALEGQGCPHFHCDVCGAAEYELDGDGILLCRLEDFDWNSSPDFAEEALQRECDVVGQVGDADINGCARLSRREAPMRG